MLLSGAVLSLFAGSQSVKVIGAVVIVLGLAVIRFSRFNSKSGKRSAARGDAGCWSAVDKLEAGVYLLAALLFVTTMAADLSGYFSDVLTYSFVAVLAVAVVLYFFKRILGYRLR
jgi:hypothetical protein